jgi:hypothetical protein
VTSAASPPPVSPFVGLFELPPFDAQTWEEQSDCVLERLPLAAEAWLLKSFLTPRQVQLLRDPACANCVTPVGINGMAKGFEPGDQVGFWRASAVDATLAAMMWERVPPQLKEPRRFDETTHADWEGHTGWTPDGVNSLFRFLLYRAGEGSLIAHYDAPYVQSNERQTLYSFLIYLTDSQESGATRFLDDGQDGVPFSQRQFADWDRHGAPSEVRHVVRAKAGDALLFEHRVLHDVLLKSGPADELSLRLDLLFRKS